MNWTEIETKACRDMKGGVLHPDECVPIHIQDIHWFVRPLFPPEDICFNATVGDDVTFDVDAGGGDVEIQRVAGELIEGLPEHLDGNTLVLDLVGGYLAKVCKYVLMLIDQQYELDNETKSALMSFKGVAPAWLEQGIRHAQSMPPNEVDNGDDAQSNTEA